MWSNKDDKNALKECIEQKTRSENTKGGATVMKIHEWNMELRQNNMSMDEHNLDMKKEKIECFEAQRQHERENELKQTNDREHGYEVREQELLLRQQLFDARESDMNEKTAAFQPTLRQNEKDQKLRFETAAKMKPEVDMMVARQKLEEKEEVV